MTPDNIYFGLHWLAIGALLWWFAPMIFWFGVILGAACVGAGFCQGLAKRGTP